MEKVLTGRRRWAAVLVLVLAAALLRLLRLDQVPPGWRDDELINSLVISQHALDGEWAFFYPDASGHEALYHVSNAIFLALFGPGVPGIRWLSALLGVLAVALTFCLGRQLFGDLTGLVAALGTAFSFWSLMYSRIGLRHISLVPLMLAGWIALWSGVESVQRSPEVPRRWAGYEWFMASGVLLGVSFYTYFAARALPFVLLGLAAYWAVFERRRSVRLDKGVAASLAVASLLAVPLAVSLYFLPEMTGRVEELAIPVTEAGRGNIQPLLHHMAVTLSMFHGDGDDEWLYNIPHRPVFNTLGAALMWGGVAVSAVRAVGGRRASHRSESAFLLLWLVAGLAPAFASVPPASLGHSIVAQPVAYLLPGVALEAAAEWIRARRGRWLWLVWGVATLFLVTNAIRDCRDYFSVWPKRGMVRYLYRGDIHDLAVFLNDHPGVSDVAVGSALAGPWDREALLVDLKRPISDRWFDPRRALLFPAGGGQMAFTTFPDLAGELRDWLAATAMPLASSGSFEVYSVRPPALGGELLPGGDACLFDNGISLIHLAKLDSAVLSGWRAERPPFGLPPFRLVSNPPPPGVETRPRLAVFAHLLSPKGATIAIDDGLWVDPYWMQPGDIWLQLHRFERPVEQSILELGFYDPVTGERVPSCTGEDRVLIDIG